jgi:hypothetical protein
MAENREESKDRSATFHEDCCCPVCTFMKISKEGRQRTGGFLNHFLNAQIELLHAAKSLVDVGISALENRKSGDESGKASKTGAE